MYLEFWLHAAIQYANFAFYNWLINLKSRQERRPMQDEGITRVINPTDSKLPAYNSNAMNARPWMRVRAFKASRKTWPFSTWILREARSQIRRQKALIFHRKYRIRKHQPKFQHGSFTHSPSVHSIRPRNLRHSATSTSKSCASIAFYPMCIKVMKFLL